MAVPVERLVVSAAVVETAAVPVNRTAVIATIVVIAAITVIIACSWAVAAMPGICAGSAEANTEQPCDTDASCQGRCAQHPFDSHSVTPFPSTRQ